MNRTTLTTVAMATAGVMLAHQVASKAFRDATFLSAWPATALPVMTLVTAALVLALVPLFSKLLARFSPLTIVTLGFALSAAGHLFEWNAYGGGRALAVLIYLHLAGVSALLLSGFWSLIAERFDPAAARAAYGRIAASGTLGGVAGSIAADRVAATGLDSVLLLLAALHMGCVVGLLALKRAPALLPRDTDAPQPATSTRDLLRTPYVRTMASLVLLTSAGSAMLDYLLKSHATESLGTGTGLLRFFAVYYGSVQVLSFLAQAGAGNALKGLGIGGSIRALPSGVGLVGLLALVFQSWPFIAGVRAIESVLRGSVFRSAYELLFVPMDPQERRRVKTFLDVTCDRVGESVGAGFVQLLLIAPLASVTAGLLTIVLLVEAAAFWLGRRLDTLYLGVVEAQLLRHREAPPVSMVSEIGWSIIQLPATATPSPASGTLATPSFAPHAPAHADARLELLAELRSGDVARVSTALTRTRDFERMHVAQVIDLLAWDDVLTPAREALERSVVHASGMLTDALLEASTDFAIRRRLPRVLATSPTPRTLDGVVRGLDDSRFEVRYHCSRAINRMLALEPQLPIDHARIIAVIERELSVPPQVWQGYRLLDRPELEGAGGGDTPETAGETSRNLEHIFALLSTIVAREPLDAAVRGISSTNPGVRGLAVEYLDQVLPAAVLERLRQMMAATPSASGAPSQSGSPPPATPSSTPR